ncbi:MAG: glucokinase [Myxococcales bacterium]
MIVLAGDIGGTNTRLALFEVDRYVPGGNTTPHRSLWERTYPSASQSSLDAIAEMFLQEARAAVPALHGPPERACFGIAGPVEGNVCRATNLPWIVDGRTLSQRLGVRLVRLVNDFYAAALGSLSVPAEDLAVLGGGPPEARGPVAVLGAGTGLGQAFLLWSAVENRYQVVPSEGGHADFAPRTPLECDLLRYLAARYGRVSYERVLSGHGLVDLYAFFSEEPAFRMLGNPATQAAMATADPAAVISQRALDGSDPICAAALSVFCGVLGALAGNLALTVLATGGVFVAGGIAPRVLPFLQKGIFREAFDRKGRLQPLVQRLPVMVVTHAQPGLLGAATVAASL